MSVILFSTEKDDDIKSEKPFTLKKSPHCVSTTSSVNVDEEMNCRISPTSKRHQDASRNESGIIRCNDSTEPQMHSDDLFYATVSFSKHTNCSGITPQTGSVTYSSVELKSKGPSDIWSQGCLHLKSISCKKYSILWQKI